MDGWTTRPTGWNLVRSLGEYDEPSGVCLTQRVRNYDHIDYIFVLAGGLDQEGRNHPWVKDRLDMALELYWVCPRKIVILGGGTYHKPPHVNDEGFVQHEATIGAKYLIQHGVKPTDIYREWGSYDTIANGFFSLLNFVIPLKISNILVLTSDFHIPRSKAIFFWIYGLWNKKMGIKSGKGIPGLEETLNPEERNEENDDQLCGGGCKLDFLRVWTKHLDQEIMTARKEKEDQALIRLKTVISRIDTWEKFHEWFYQEHQAYNCQFEVGREKIDHITMKSY